MLFYNLGHLLTNIIIYVLVRAIYFVAAAFFGRSTKYAMTSPATAYVALAHCKCYKRIDEMYELENLPRFLLL